jgi:hypothetical protein
VTYDGPIPDKHYSTAFVYYLTVLRNGYPIVIQIGIDKPTAPRATMIPKDQTLIVPVTDTGLNPHPVFGQLVK